MLIHNYLPTVAFVYENDDDDAAADDDADDDDDDDGDDDCCNVSLTYLKSTYVLPAMVKLVVPFNH